MTTRLRMAPTTGIDTPVGSKRVDRELGIIYGASALQTGEALGHDMLIDEKTIEQARDHGNAAKLGIKVRFTHPGMCSDGMGKLLGRQRNFRIGGEKNDKVVGDIHFNPAAATAPDGDLSGYVMDLAESDPAAFAMSIVFQNAAVWKMDDGSEVPVRRDEYGRYVPPKGAIGEKPYARIKQLFASDIVDEPAANRDGLFADARLVSSFSSTSNETAADAFAALDLMREQLGMSLDAAHEFTARYFAARGSKQPAGAKPATKESTVLTKERLAELSKAHPTHQATIIEMFAADKTEDEIVAALTERDRAAALAALTERVSVAEAAAVKAKADGEALSKSHSEALAAKDAELLAEKAKVAGLESRIQVLTALGKDRKDPGEELNPPKDKPRDVTKADLAAGKVSTEDIRSGRAVVSD